VSHKKVNLQVETPIKGGMAVLAGVLLLVAAILLSKGQITDSNVNASQITTDQPLRVTESPPAQTRTTLARSETSEAPPEQASPSPSQLLPEEQLDHYLAEGRPILAFFHSDTCAKCIEMTRIVEQVYPDFADRVALVDVNVYDESNQSLLGRAGIQVIPTVIFIDRDQQGQVHAGVMLAETLREHLDALAPEP